MLSNFKKIEAIYLANIYLDACLDTWFQENWGQSAQMVRYADDAIFVFTDMKKAEEFKLSLASRFESFKLKMNDDKSDISGSNPFRSHRKPL